MFPKTLLILITVLALTSLACGVTINLPVTKVTPGPIQTDEISIPVPQNAGRPIRLTLGFGAGDLKVAPGDQTALVKGIATYNVKELKPEITSEGADVTIQTGDFQLKGIPNFGDDYKNSWDLTLADSPMDLRIHAGAYKGEIDLGGLSIESLEVNDGAADVRLEFSAPNKAEMGEFRYSTGASKVTLVGLANANFESMVFKAGAGDYRLDFSGDFKHDATVTIDAGFSSITLVVPQGISARVFVDGGLANVDLGGAWDKSGNEYTLQGDGPRLTINVNIGAGSLTLRN